MAKRKMKKASINMTSASAKKDGFGETMAYSIVGGSLMGILLSLFFLTEYSVETGIIAGAVAGVVFAAVFGALNKQL